MNLIILLIIEKLRKNKKRKERVFPGNLSFKNVLLFDLNFSKNFIFFLEIEYFIQLYWFFRLIHYFISSILIFIVFLNDKKFNTYIYIFLLNTLMFYWKLSYCFLFRPIVDIFNIFKYVYFFIFFDLICIWNNFIYTQYKNIYHVYLL